MPKKNGSKRPFLVSFSVVMVALIAITLGLPYLSGPSVYHFPTNYNVTLEPWMSFVPPNAVSAGEIKVAQLVATGLSYSDVGATFLNVYQASLALTPGNVSMVATYDLPAPSITENGTEVDIFQPTAIAYSSVLNQLNSNDLVIKENYRSSTIYRVLNHNVVNNSLTLGYLFFENGFIVYTQGSADPLGDIKKAMDFSLDGSPGLFENKTVQAAVYASTGGGSDFLAFYYVSFSTQLQNFTMGSKIVYYSAGNYDGKYAFGFEDLRVSKARFDDVRNLYPDGSSYSILDNYVVADFVFAPGGIRNEIEGF
jgi:hypothetical protein